MDLAVVQIEGRLSRVLLAAHPEMMILAALIPRIGTLSSLEAVT
jgi:hypothetical protein